MRTFAGLLVLLVASGIVAARAQTPDPFAAMIAAGEAFQKEGLDAAVAILRKAIDDSRKDGKVDPAMAPAFGMLADSVRNGGDAVEALRLAEEGLSLAAADPAADPLAATMLTISRAYALGELGRYGEAIAAADAALPPYMEVFGSDAATDALEAEKTRWIEARRDDLAGEASSTWAEADRLEAGSEAGSAVSALPLRRDTARLYEEAGGFPKSLASALAALAQTASTAGELAEAREAAVRAAGMVDVLKDEPPSELASLLLIVANVFYLQGRHDIAAPLQSRAILLYATGEDRDDALARFIEEASAKRNPFAAFDTSDEVRPLLRRALIEFGDTCRQLGFLRLTGNAYARAVQLVPEGDTETASTITARFAAAAVAEGEPELAREVLADALQLAEKGGDRAWIDLLTFWSARVDIGLGLAAERQLQDAAVRLLAPLDRTDPNAIRIRLEMTKSLRQSPAGRRQPGAILAASGEAMAGMIARLGRSGAEISADADLDRQNAREIFSLYVAAAWEAGASAAPEPGR